MDSLQPCMTRQVEHLRLLGQEDVLASKFNMFVSMKTVDGILSIAVPGALTGYAEMHKKYGHTPWKVLIQSVIKLCRTGFEDSTTVDFYLRLSDVMPLILDILACRSQSQN